MSITSTHPSVTASEATVTLTGTQNDLNFSGASLLRLNNATDLTITGFLAGVAGQVLSIVSVGAGNVFFSHQTGSSAVNRLVNFVTVGTTPLAAGAGTAVFQYDGTTQRWRLVAHSQGAWLTPTFNAGDFTGSGAMTVTLTSGDVVVFKYFVSGKTMTVALGLNSFTVGGVVSTLVQVLIPLGMQAASQVESLGRVGNNTTLGTTTGLYVTVPSSDATKIFIATSPLGTVNWAASANNSAAFGTISFDLV